LSSIATNATPTSPPIAAPYMASLNTISPLVDLLPHSLAEVISIEENKKLKKTIDKKFKFYRWQIVL